VVCVTDGNFEGDGAARVAACEQVCAELGVGAFSCLGLPDDPAGCLDLDALVAALRARFPEPPELIFTHSPHGEYGHFNHIDVSLAVHRAFPEHPRLYVVAAHMFPELRVHLDELTFSRKLEIAGRYYTKQLRQAWRLMANLADEGFVRLPAREVEAMHQLLMEGEAVASERAPHYRHVLPLIRPRR